MERLVSNFSQPSTTEMSFNKRGLDLTTIINESEENEPNVFISSKTGVISFQTSISNQIWLITFIGLLIVVIFALLVYLNLKRKTEKAKKLVQFSSSSTNDSKRGSKPDKIEFVVPNLIVPENVDNNICEDSFSGFDCIPLDRDERNSETPSSNTFDPKLDIIQCPNSTQQPNLGKVIFVLHYSILRQQLLFTLLSAAELPLTRKRTAPNPFAKIVLLPKEKFPKFVTKVQRNTQYPIFNELFVFPIKVEDLDDQVLRISIWDCDRFSRKHFIGQVEYKLKEAGLTNSIKNDIISDETCCPLSSLTLKISSLKSKFGQKTFHIFNYNF